MKGRSLIARLWAAAAILALLFTNVAAAGFICGGDDDRGTLCMKVCQDEPQKHEIFSLDIAPPPRQDGLRIEPLLHLPVTSYRAEIAPRATSPPPLLLYSRYLK